MKPAPKLGPRQEAVSQGPKAVEPPEASPLDIDLTPQKPDWYCVESDEYGDDWACFRTVDECTVFIEEQSRLIAEATLAEDTIFKDGICRVGCFEGTVDEVVAMMVRDALDAGVIVPMGVPPLVVTYPPRGDGE